jgi:hypothetical protein
VCSRETFGGARLPKDPRLSAKEYHPNQGGLVLDRQTRRLVRRSFGHSDFSLPSEQRSRSRGPSEARSLTQPARPRRTYHVFISNQSRRNFGASAWTWLHLGPRLRLRCPLANKNRYVQSYVGQVGERFGLAKQIVNADRSPPRKPWVFREPRPTKVSDRSRR